MFMMQFVSTNSERLLTVIYLLIFSLFYIDYCFLKNFLVFYHSIPSEAIDDSQNGQDNITNFAIVISSSSLLCETEEY